MSENKDDLAEGVNRIKGEVKKVSKSTALAIAAAIGVVAALALNEAMKALFASLFSPATTLVAQFGYAFSSSLPRRWSATGRRSTRNSRQVPVEGEAEKKSSLCVAWATRIAVAKGDRFVFAF